MGAAGIVVECPLRFFAQEFRETWTFEGDGPSHVTRHFELESRSLLTKPALYLIRVLLKRAIRAQLDQLASVDQRSE